MLYDTADIPSVREGCRRQWAGLAHSAEVKLVTQILNLALVVIHKAALDAQAGDFVLSIR
jgi:hypothetical protein